MNGRRSTFALIGYGLGLIMVITGIASLLTARPAPEIATGGVTLILATGLIGSSNGNGRK
jgi:hypothetical protein